MPRDISVLTAAPLTETPIAERLVAQVGRLLEERALGTLSVPNEGAGCDHTLGIAFARLDRVDEIHLPATGLAEVLFIGFWRSFLYVGPFWNSASPGCPRCLVTRVANSHYGPDVRRGVDIVSAGFAPQAHRAWSKPALASVAYVIVEELVARLREAVPRTTSAVFVFDGSSFQGRYHPFVPDSACARCGRPEPSVPPAMKAEAFADLDPQSLRTRDLEDLGKLVEDLYVSPALGIVRTVLHDLQSPFGSCTIELMTRWQQTDPTIGRSISFDRSKSIAVLESLERYAGWHCGGREIAVTAPYRQVAHQALDPMQLGVHPTECYDRPGFRYRRFDDSLDVDWVWGYSLARDEPVLVPERYAFYGVRPGARPSFVYEISNGCAVGSSLEEAVVHGLAELVERDSFLLAWYGKLRLPEMSLYHLAGGAGELLRKCEFFTRSRFRAFNSTMEHGIPSVWLVAESDEGGPCVVAGAGAHRSPVRALEKALYEVAGSVLRLRHVYAERRSDGMLMLSEPHRVLTMEHHSLVNCLPEARDRFSFLLCQDADPVPFEEAWSRDDERVAGPAPAILGDVIDAGFDVIVVDQTMPELERAGVACVKTIVPGFLPMTFGHANRRTDGMPRLAGQVRLPYVSALTDKREIGALPHPFP